MSESDKKKVMSVLIHVTSWIIICLLPYLLNRSGNHSPHSSVEHNGVLYISYLTIFYVNYFLLIERYCFKGRSMMYFVTNMIMIFVLCAIIQYVHEQFRPEFLGEDLSAKRPPLIGKIFNDLITLFMSAGASLLVKMRLRQSDLEKRNLILEQERTEAELKHLKQQLNPHFIFNTLNNIYALIDINTEKAQRALLDMSNLLRYMLYENKDRFVLVEQELNFIRDYIDLMRLRYTRQTIIETSINSGSCGNDTIASMLFIPLIENAFKHGTNAMQESFIKINIGIIAPHTICCKIENSNFPKNDSDRSGSGIGLENLKRQLQLLYPQHYTLNFNVTKEVYAVTLIVNLQKQ